MKFTLGNLIGLPSKNESLGRFYRYRSVFHDYVVYVLWIKFVYLLWTPYNFEETGSAI